MSEQRTSPEQRAELWRRYEAALADIEATWPWQHAPTIAAPALLADADALAGALKEVERLRAALREIRGEAYYGLERQSPDGVLLSVEGTARRALGLPMAPWGLGDDAPGQDAERSGHGH